MLQVTFHALEGPTGHATRVTKGSILLDDSNLLRAYPATHQDVNLFKALIQEPTSDYDENGDDVDYDPFKTRWDGSRIYIGSISRTRWGRQVRPK